MSPFSALSQSSSPDIIWQTSTNSDRINTCTFSHDGSQFITGSSDRLINIWNASDGTLQQTLDANAAEIHDNSIESLAISPNGAKIVSVSYRTVKLWTLPAGTLQTLGGHTDWVVGCAFSPSGTMFATASFDSTIKVWSSSGVLLKTFTSADQKRCVVFSPDGSMLASAGGDNVVTIRRTSDWSTVNTLQGHTDSIYAIAWSPNGAYIGTGSYDQTAKVWNVSDGSLRFSIGNNNGNIYGVAFSPDSATFAFTTGEGNSIKLARTSDGAVTRTYTSNVANVQCVAYSPQGTLGYGRVDRTIIVARVGGSGTTVSPPSITLTSPANGASFNTGANITLNATASAGAGVQKVEFFVNGTSVAVDSASPYTTTINSAAKGSYSIRAVVTARDGRTASDTANITVADAPPESTPPRVAVQGPPNGSRLLTNNPVLRGVASDNIAVAQVLVAVNSDTYQQADGTTSWQMQLNLNDGPNTIKVKSVDTSGNQSAVVTWTLTYIQSSQISVGISGNGSVSPNLDGRFIQIGQRCIMTALPAAGYVFNGWSGDISSGTQTISFAMQQDLSLQANFVPNPFIPVMGLYNGLVTTDQTDIDHEGCFRATVGSSGAFSAMLYLGRQVFSFAGKFTGDGDYSTTIVRDGTSYQIILQLHVADDSDQLTGTIDDGSVTAAISSDRWTWNARTNPAPAGRYTVLIPGGDSPDQPQGAGYATVNVTTSGTISYFGRLSDGMAVSRSTYLAKDGTWPFFNWGSGFDIVLGQITIEDIPGTSDMDGEVTWARRQSSSPIYPNGFVIQSSLVGSLFTPASPGNNVLNLDVIPDNVSVAIGGADTAGEVDFTGTLDRFNRFISDDTGASIRFRMSMSNGSGVMNGGFMDPATSRTVSFQGVVFQKQNIAAGFWLGSLLSGYTVIQGN
ncbi:MAG: Ig-like domain-containing protein [Limisphaerales bacterium]